MNAARNPDARATVLVPLAHGWHSLQTVPLKLRRPTIEEILGSSGKPKTLGESIRYHRIRLGLRQEDLAGKLRVGKTAVSQWENDETQPQASRLRKALALLEIRPNSLSR